MARICEKNTCPRGIATHDPKFKSKYKGHKDHIVRMLQFLAEDVRRQLAFIGAKSLDELIGRIDLLTVQEHHQMLIESRGIDLSLFTADEGDNLAQKNRQANPSDEGISALNQTSVALREQVSDEE